MQFQSRPIRRLAAAVAISTALAASPFFFKHSQAPARPGPPPAVQILAPAPAARLPPPPAPALSPLTSATPPSPSAVHALVGNPAAGVHLLAGASALSVQVPKQPALLAPTPLLAQIQLPAQPPTPKSSDSPSEWAGYIALGLSVIAFGAQLGRNHKVKLQKDISLESWGTALAMDGAWAVYGAATGLVSVAISNLAALLPRTYGVYQIARGHVATRRQALWRLAEETICFYGEAARRHQAFLAGGILAFSVDPINTLAGAATLPALLQFGKTRQDMGTGGISIASQAGYFAASVFWGLNGLVFQRPIVVASSLVGALLTGQVLRYKRAQLKKDGTPLVPALREESADTLRFAQDAAKSAGQLFASGFSRLKSRRSSVQPPISPA
ncbi:MAG: hypothetical protein KGH63_00430 [Candidatus Micrarchaeota archaeon]|nr:hypothetical protein [Candidatus Micrarchaeota archaeon]